MDLDRDIFALFLLVFLHDIFSNFDLVFGSCTFFCRIGVRRRGGLRRDREEERREEEEEVTGEELAYIAGEEEEVAGEEFTGASKRRKEKP